SAAAPVVSAPEFIGLRMAGRSPRAATPSGSICTPSARSLRRARVIMRALWTIRQLASGWLNLMILRCSPRLFFGNDAATAEGQLLDKVVERLALVGRCSILVRIAERRSRRRGAVELGTFFR